MRKAGLPAAANSLLCSGLLRRDRRRVGEPAGLPTASFCPLTGNSPPVVSNRARTSDNLSVPGNVARNMPDP